MKGVLKFLFPTLLLSLAASCTPFGTIPKVEFTFLNSTSSTTVVITPDSGEDWSRVLTLTPGTSDSIESENSNIDFTATVGGYEVDRSSYFSYNDLTRTYTFYDYP